jgi:hypothetical protein
MNFVQRDNIFFTKLFFSCYPTTIHLIFLIIYIIGFHLLILAKNPNLEKFSIHSNKFFQNFHLSLTSGKRVNTKTEKVVTWITCCIIIKIKYIKLSIEEEYDKPIVNKKTWRKCDFPVWERVKHIVPVYNAHPSYKIKNLGKILHIMQP